MQKVNTAPLNYMHYEDILLRDKKHRIQNLTNCGELEDSLQSTGSRGYLLKCYSLILEEPR